LYKALHSTHSTGVGFLCLNRSHIFLTELQSCFLTCLSVCVRVCVYTSACFLQSATHQVMAHTINEVNRLKQVRK